MNVKGRVSGYLSISKLGGRLRHTTAVAAVVLGLLLVACSGAAVTSDSPATGDNAAPAGAVTSSQGTEGRPVNILDSGANGDAPGSEAQVVLDSLDADAIVAAQEQVLIGIYDRVLPSVVKIRVVNQRTGLRDGSRFFPNPPDLPEEFFKQGSGSGFVWDDRGRIVTNHHVIEDADRIVVTFSDRAEVEAILLGSDPDSDLAVLQVEMPEGTFAPPAPLADSDAVRIGQMASAIGNPFGQEFTITNGIVSAVGRTIRSGNSSFSIPEVIQTDAPINPGNSGGPLLDRRGEVIGVNTQIISRSGANSGIGFAVPINTAKRVIPTLIDGGSYAYAWLGISGVTMNADMAALMDLPRDTHGTLVVELSPDGPAQDAGLRGSDETRAFEGSDVPVGGDIIVAINDTPIRDMDQLIAYLVNNTRPDDKVTLEVMRAGGERKTINVTLGQRPG